MVKNIGFTIKTKKKLKCLNKEKRDKLTEDIAAMNFPLHFVFSHKYEALIYNTCNFIIYDTTSYITLSVHQI